MQTPSSAGLLTPDVTPSLSDITAETGTAMFPILSQLCRRVLCIPATSASSERLFSTAGLTITNDRARLLPDNAEDLMF